MDDLAKIILNNKEENNKLIDLMYDAIIKFYNTYNNSKIDKYVLTKQKKNILSILTIREKVYSLVKELSDYNFNGKDEFKTKNNHIFTDIKVNTDTLTKLFLLYTVFYLIDSIHYDKKFIIGIDFEFSEKKIALIQFSFYPLRKYNSLFIIAPPIMKGEYLELLIKTVFTSPIYRVTHGSDSLDIPYVFEELFLGDSQKKIDFTTTHVDTRFLCEFYKKSIDFPDSKCSIYDALLYFDVITQKKYDELNKNNEVMGPSQDVNWDIKKMSSHHLKYASCDVLFLKDFVRNIFLKSKKENKDLHKQIKYISQINRMVIFEKHEISDVMNSTKLQLDPINNYFTFYKNNKKTLISIYNDVIKDITIPELNLKATKLLEINYYKTPITLLYKRAIYSILTNNFPIYKTKTERYMIKINFKDIYDNYLKLNLKRVVYLLDKFYDASKKILLK
jgi:hypothetical protein